MAVEGGMKCVKFLVFFFNFIFWLCGVALLAVGSYALLALAQAPVAAPGWTPAGVAALGVVICLSSVLGCCGAWRESHCLLTAFAVLLSLIFLLEVAAAITGYVFKDKVHGLAEEGLWEAMRSYERDPAVAAALDALQEKFSCCGVNNYTDWASVGGFGANGTVPGSCCGAGGGSCSVRGGPGAVFRRGCLPSLQAGLRRSAVLVAAVALGVACFEILGVVFSCCLIRGIRSGYEVM